MDVTLSCFDSMGWIFVVYGLDFVLDFDDAASVVFEASECA